jgi:hypothetical protein
VSAGHAVELRSLAGVAVPCDGPGPPARVAVHSLAVRIYEEALDILLRPRDFQVRLHPNEIQLNGEIGPIPFEARLTGTRTPEGYLRIEIASIRAASFIPVPTSLVAGQIERQVEGKPGIVRTDGTTIDFDLGRVLREKAPIDVFPPLKAIRITPEWIDLEYAAAPEAPV